MNPKAIVCSNCGAGLEPRVLETKIKCTYCGTVFALVRDRDGVSGLASEDQAPDHVPAPPPGSTPWSAPGGPGAPASQAPATIAGMDAQTVERLERDALLVVRGLEAAERVVEGGGIARRGGGCLGSVLVLVSLASLALALLA